MDYEKIKEYLMAMGNFSAEDMEKYKFILDASVTSVLDMLNDSADVTDDRIMQLMASRAYLKICCIDSAESGVTSFKAGDVSYTEKAGTALDGAKEIYRIALDDCSQFINDAGFAFLGV
mgnify:CR=1 FL=1|nr:MAG TPA: hypothetical protein [Caudoviricetes sp.]